MDEDYRQLTTGWPIKGEVGGRNRMSNLDVLRSFLYRRKDGAYSGNMSVRDSCLYSYGTPIARYQLKFPTSIEDLQDRSQDRIMLFVKTGPYSFTTATRHISPLKYWLSTSLEDRYRVYWVMNPMAEVSLQHQANLHAMELDAEGTAAAAARGPKDRREIKRVVANAMLRHAWRYAKDVGLHCHIAPDAPLFVVNDWLQEFRSKELPNLCRVFQLMWETEEKSRASQSTVGDYRQDGGTDFPQPQEAEAPGGTAAESDAL